MNPHDTGSVQPSRITPAIFGSGTYDAYQQIRALRSQTKWCAICGERAMSIVDIGWGFSLQLASCQKDSCIKLATAAIEYAQGIVTIPSELIILRRSDGRIKAKTTAERIFIHDATVHCVNRSDPIPQEERVIPLRTILETKKEFKIDISHKHPAFQTHILATLLAHGIGAGYFITEI